MPTSWWFWGRDHQQWGHILGAVDVCTKFNAIRLTVVEIFQSAQKRS